MGANCEIFAFDYDRYCDCVVSAIQRLLRTGEPGPWLEAVLRATNPERFWSFLLKNIRIPHPYQGPPPTDLSPSHLFLDDQLATCQRPTAWALRPEVDSISHLQRLYQSAIEVSCLGPSRFMGRRRFPESLWDDVCSLAEEAGTTPPDDIEPLLRNLSQRGKNWITNSGGFAEGIHGWLGPDESRQLATALGELPLPRRAGDTQTPDVPGSSSAAHAVWDPYAHLADIRDIAASAAARGQGLLWGHDVNDRSGVSGGQTFDPAWRTATVLAIARTVAEQCDFAALPVLADALEEAGCTSAVVLAHCREVGDHVDGCWVVNRILRSE
jgi:hypothetical protein